MKIKKESSKFISAFAVALLSLPLLGFPLPKGATQKNTLSHKQVRWLIGHAETPAQHAQLAVYYRQQANRCLKEAKEHNEMTWPEGNAAKHGWLVYTPGAHCRYWAGVLTKRAQQDEALAAVQEKMTQETATQK